MNILKELKSITCDPEGNVCIAGSEGDRKIMQEVINWLSQDNIKAHITDFCYDNVVDKDCREDTERFLNLFMQDFMGRG